MGRTRERKNKTCWFGRECGRVRNKKCAFRMSLFCKSLANIFCSFFSTRPMAALVKVGPFETDFDSGMPIGEAFLCIDDTSNGLLGMNSWFIADYNRIKQANFVSAFVIEAKREKMSGQHLSFAIKLKQYLISLLAVVREMISRRHRVGVSEPKQIQLVSPQSLNICQDDGLILKHSPRPQKYNEWRKAFASFCPSVRSTCVH